MLQKGGGGGGVFNVEARCVAVSTSDVCSGDQKVGGSSPAWSLHVSCYSLRQEALPYATLSLSTQVYIYLI